MRTHLLTLVVITEQRVGQGAERGEQDAVGGAERQDHVQVPGERGQPGAQAEGEVGDEVEGADAQTLLQFLQESCGRGKGWVGVARPSRGRRGGGGRGRPLACQVTCRWLQREDPPAGLLHGRARPRVSSFTPAP